MIRNDRSFRWTALDRWMRCVAVGVAALGAVASGGVAWGQPDPGNETYPPNLTGFINSPQLVVNHLLPVKCGQFLTTDLDTAQIEFGVSQLSTAPVFPAATSPVFVNSPISLMPDWLTSPGTGWRNAPIPTGSPTVVGTPGRWIVGTPASSTQLISGPVQRISNPAGLPNGQFGGGFLRIVPTFKSSGVSGRLADVKLFNPMDPSVDTDASVMYTTFQQTYDVSGFGFNGTIGGLFAFFMNLPNAPSASGALSYKAWAAIDYANPLTPDACIKMAELVTARSKANAAWDNWFGPIGAPTVNSAMPMAGGTANISMTQLGGSLNVGLGSWKSAPMGLLPGDRFTIYTSLSAIVDPGAEFGLMKLTEEDVTNTPMPDFVVNFSAPVPEPTGGMLALAGVVAGMIGGRRLRRSALLQPPA
jgi:hypothetical protein